MTELNSALREMGCPRGERRKKKKACKFKHDDKQQDDSQPQDEETTQETFPDKSQWQVGNEDENDTPWEDEQGLAHHLLTPDEEVEACFYPLPRESE